MHISRRQHPNSGTKNSWIRTSTCRNIPFNYGSYYLKVKTVWTL